MPLWKQEFSKFTDRSLREMKKYADNTNEEREWMCYVYDDHGVYELGGVSYGEESAIKVSPQSKGAQASQLWNGKCAQHAFCACCIKLERFVIVKR